jgi:hypothetical protein
VVWVVDSGDRERLAEVRVSFFFSLCSSFLFS